LKPRIKNGQPDIWKEKVTKEKTKGLGGFWHGREIFESFVLI
jgi:hypothetical protein